MSRFNAIAYDLIDSLLVILAKEVQTRIATGIALARELNRNVAYFLKDLLSVMDRGQVFRLIYTYITQLQPASADPTVITLKFQALKILTDHEVRFLPYMMLFFLFVAESAPCSTTCS